MTGLSEEAASLEKLQRAEAATKIAIWSEQASWEGPLREFARVSNPDADLDRRLKFFRWEVVSRVESAAQDYARLESSPEQELAVLNSVFFRDLGFRKERGYFGLDSVLAKRMAPPALLAMLFAWVAEIFFRELKRQHVACDPNRVCYFQRIDLVFGTPTNVVRATPWPTHDFGHVILMDLDNRGVCVANEIWCAWAEKSANGFLAKNMTEALISALTELFINLDLKVKESAAERVTGDAQILEHIHRQLSILDLIIALQPSETKRLADRAVLKTRLGHRQTALHDLKRFFAFHEKADAPAEIVTLFESLNKTLVSPSASKEPDWN